MLKYPREIIDNINNMAKNDFWKFIENDYNLSFLTYYIKWLSKEYQTNIISNIKSNFIKFNKNHWYWIPFSLSTYSKETQNLIMNNIGFLQTNFWCTKWCYFCGCDAIFSEKPLCIPFNQLKYLIKKYSKDLNKNYTYLYWASDPLDYNFRGKTYKNILKVYQKYIKKDPYTSSAINKGNFSLYKQISNKVTRVSYLWRDKQIYDEIKDNINDNSYEWYSLKKIWFNWLRWYKNQKYDNWIWCLNGTLLTPFFAYNLISIWKCNNFFPQWLLCYPIGKIINEPIKVWNNLIDYLTNKIVMYDYVDLRIQRWKFDHFVVFLRDKKNISLLVCSKKEMDKWIIKINQVVTISLDEYYKFCFSKGGQKILLKIETQESSNS